MEESEEGSCDKTSAINSEENEHDDESFFGSNFDEGNDDSDRTEAEGSCDKTSAIDSEENEHDDESLFGSNFDEGNDDIDRTEAEGSCDKTSAINSEENEHDDESFFGSNFDGNDDSDRTEDLYLDTTSQSLTSSDVDFFSRYEKDDLYFTRRDSGGETQTKIDRILNDLGLPRERHLTIQEISKVRGIHVCNEGEDLIGKFFTAINSLNHRVADLSTKRKDSVVEGVQEKQRKPDSSDSDWMDLVEEESYSDRKEEQQNNLSFLDVLFFILNKCDPFLLQEVIKKLSLCQHAVPILLPNLLHMKVMFLLWGLRSVVKKWKDSSQLREESIVSCEIPIISFVRLGDIPFSKSLIINKLIGPVQGNSDHSYFLTQEDDQSTSIWSKGTLEGVWLLPQGSTDTTCRRPVGLFNLRGDGMNYDCQVDFACLTSASVVVMIKKQLLYDKEYKEKVDAIKLKSKNLILVVIDPEAKAMIAKPKIHSQNMRILNVSGGNAQFVAHSVWDQILITLQTQQNVCHSLESSLDLCIKLGIEVDELDENCQNAKRIAAMILNTSTKGLIDYKKKSLPLHTKFWREWSTLDKSATREGVGNRDTYLDKNYQHKKLIRKKQCDEGISKPMSILLTSLLELKPVGRWFLISWLQLKLNNLSLQTLLPLLEELSDLATKGRQNGLLIANMRQKTAGKTSPRTVQGDLRKLEEDKKKILQRKKEITKTFDENCLGFEHFVREMGQIYESFSEMNMQNGAVDFRKLPRIAAALLSKGYPIEILDGDASHVPNSWLQAVFRSLEELLGNEKIFVISVIGIQSSGKSTLMNCMFGVRFAVSAGRCTRGVFMQILPVDDEIQKKLQCSYICVIDTEGLRAPERMMMDDCKEDNELATFALCLSDLTLINIGGQTVAKDMTDVLEIAAHAFIRMKGVHLYSECRLVQQFVADISAQQRNKTATESILVKLDEATAAAAKAEGLQHQFGRFQDIFNLRIGEGEECFQYIPSLWRGGIMDPPDNHYSRVVLGLKRDILGTIASEKRSHMRFSEMRKRIADVWSAVKEEDFIFSFQNTNETIEYNKFQTYYISLVGTMIGSLQDFELQAKAEIDVADSESIDIVLNQRLESLEVHADVLQFEVREKLQKYVKEASNDSEIVKNQQPFVEADLQEKRREKCSDIRKALREKAKYVEEQAEHKQIIPDLQKELMEKMKLVARSLQVNYLNDRQETASIDKSQLKREIDEEFETAWTRLTREIVKGNSMADSIVHKIRNQVLQTLQAEIKKQSYSKEVNRLLKDKPLGFYEDDRLFPNLCKKSPSVVELDRSVHKYASNFLTGQICQNRQFGLHVKDIEFFVQSLFGEFAALNRKIQAEVDDKMSASILLACLGKGVKYLENVHVEGIVRDPALRKKIAQSPVTEGELMECFLTSLNKKKGICADIAKHITASDSQGQEKQSMSYAMTLVSRLSNVWSYATGSDKQEREQETILMEEAERMIWSKICNTRQFSARTIDDFITIINQNIFRARLSHKRRVNAGARLINISVQKLAEFCAQKLKEAVLFVANSKSKLPCPEDGHTVQDIQKTFRAVVANASQAMDDKNLASEIEAGTLFRERDNNSFENSDEDRVVALKNMLPSEQEFHVREIDFILSNAENSLREKISCEQPFQQSFTQDFITRLRADIVKESSDLKHMPKMSNDVIAKVLVCSCATVIPFFERCQEEHERQRSIKYILAGKKEMMKQEFQKRCFGVCLDEFAATRVYELLVCRIESTFTALLCKALREYFEGLDLFKSRKFFLGSILKHIIQSHEHTLYERYLRYHKSFVEEWTLTFLARELNKSHVCSVETRCKEIHTCDSESKNCSDTFSHNKFSNLQFICEQVIVSMKEPLGECIRKANERVCSMDANENVDGKFDVWMQEFGDVLGAKTGLTFNFGTTLKGMYSIENYDIFSNKIEERITNNFQEGVMNQANVLNGMDEAGMQEWLRTLPSLLHKELSKRMQGCQKQCPFCGALCDFSAIKHKTHSAALHYPQGISGWHDKYTKVLVHNICTSQITTTEHYILCDCPNACSHQSNPYKDYKKDYPDWEIKPTQDMEKTKYWQYVMAQYNSHFACDYKLKEGDIPLGWKSISLEEALKSLDLAYFLED